MVKRERKYDIYMYIKKREKTEFANIKDASSKKVRRVSNKYKRGSIYVCPTICV